MRSLRVMKIVLFSMILCAAYNSAARPQQLQDDDLKDVVITMKQENHCGCDGCCAEYSVSISGDGIVTYEGVDAVNVRGTRIHSISTDQVKELVSEFYKADFFSLKDRYTSKDNGDGTISMIDHTAPITISITIKGKTKKVYNFYGAPEKFEELEKKIYEISGIDVYVKRA